MLFTVRQRARVAWLAIAAMLLPTLAPGVSHAISAAAPGAAWARAIGEICTLTGLVAQAPETERDAQAPRAARRASLHFEHCPYCLVHAGGAAPPRSLAPDFAVPGATQPESPLPRAPGIAPRWPAAQPRAPPVRA